MKEKIFPTQKKIVEPAYSGLAEPTYCYRSISDVTCYRAPVDGDDRLLSGHYPSRRAATVDNAQPEDRPEDHLEPIESMVAPTIVDEPVNSQQVEPPPLKPQI